jgi:Predicted membrane protein
MIKLKILAEYMTVFIIGAAVYSVCEICWRGYTHWTMTFAGGFCLICIYLSSNKYPDRMLWLQCAEGCLTITAIEFIIGYIVNIQLKWNVWDYTDIPFNIMGQVCLSYMAVWFIMSIPAVFICRLLRTKLFYRGVIFNGKT